MRITRYYHVTENLATGQIVIQSKYETLVKGQNGEKEMYARFAKEYVNVDEEQHWLMSEDALKELKRQITEILKTI